MGEGAVVIVVAGGAFVDVVVGEVVTKEQCARTASVAECHAGAPAEETSGALRK